MQKQARFASHLPKLEAVARHAPSGNLRPKQVHRQRNTGFVHRVASPFIAIHGRTANSSFSEKSPWCRELCNLGLGRLGAAEPKKQGKTWNCLEDYAEVCAYLDVVVDVGKVPDGLSRVDSSVVAVIEGVIAQ